MLKIGIECESIEAETWGVGRIVKKLLENIAARPELANEFRFFLYFKSHIPDYPWLANPIFVKKIVPNHSQILKNIRVDSFSFYYYIWLPVKLWFEGLDMTFFPNYMLSPLFRGKSLVILTEDIYHEIRRADLPWRYKLAYKIFAGWWAAKHATKIMAISETSKRKLTKLFKISPDRIVVNTLGIDPPKAISHQPSAISYMLYVGQAFPRRHLRETMLAFELLASKNSRFYFLDSSFSLVAIGKDKYNPQVIKKIAEDINRRLGREGIIYKEYVPEKELIRLYAGTKLLVYVSSKEAFGLPPLEALAYGVPAVVADEQINHEIYSGRAFLVRQPITLETIAEAIKEGLTNEPKREEIKNARESILEKYTWQKHTDRFLEIIRSQKLQS